MYYPNAQYMVYIHLHLPPKLAKCRWIDHTLSIWVRQCWYVDLPEFPRWTNPVVCFFAVTKPPERWPKTYRRRWKSSRTTSRREWNAEDGSRYVLRKGISSMPSLKLTASKFAPENRPKLPQQERQTSSSRIIFLVKLRGCVILL